MANCRIRPSARDVLGSLKKAIYRWKEEILSDDMNVKARPSAAVGTAIAMAALFPMARSNSASPPLPSVQIDATQAKPAEMAYGIKGSDVLYTLEISPHGIPLILIARQEFSIPGHHPTLCETMLIPKGAKPINEPDLHKIEYDLFRKLSPKQMEAISDEVRFHEPGICEGGEIRGIRNVLPKWAKIKKESDREGEIAIGSSIVGFLAAAAIASFHLFRQGRTEEDKKPAIPSSEEERMATLSDLNAIKAFNTFVFSVGIGSAALGLSDLVYGFYQYAARSADNVTNAISLLVLAAFATLGSTAIPTAWRQLRHVERESLKDGNV